MTRGQTATFDLAIGGLFALGGLVFGIVGFFAGLNNNSHATPWFLAALVLAIASPAVLLDELRLGVQGVAAWLGTLLPVLALVVGAVGFILGLTNRAHAETWQVSAVVLAILAAVTMTDALRRRQPARDSDLTGLLGLVLLLFGALAVVLGVVGFILGLADRAHSETWLMAAVISGVLALACDVSAAYSAVLLGSEAPFMPAPATPASERRSA